jgi:hypothetical protein
MTEVVALFDAEMKPCQILKRMSDFDLTDTFKVRLCIPGATEPAKREKWGTSSLNIGSVTIGSRDTSVATAVAVGEPADPDPLG